MRPILRPGRPRRFASRGWKVRCARAFACGAGFLALAFLLPPARAATTGNASVNPYQVEAAYLFNFARFVGWPEGSFEDAKAPLVVGVLGTDPFGPFLTQLVKGETIDGHPIAVRRFSHARDVDRCHILFISRSDADDLPQILGTISDRHILTVSDIPGFAGHGGMIELIDDGAHVRFRIDLKRARAASLEISAKLLRPAEVVSRIGHELEFADLFLPGTTPGELARSLTRRLSPGIFHLIRMSFQEVLPYSSP